ncbi:MAG: IS30 family transposase [Gammaproteobacteria bacterium]|nr:IS30 family transposase [Gammaproteobacteria bacterium]
MAGGYHAPLAQQRADAPATLARCPRACLARTPCECHVERLPRALHSPEQIAGILRRMNRTSRPFRSVTRRSTRRSTPCRARVAYRADCLPAASAQSRRPRARGGDRQGTIPNMTSIHLRPPEIDARIIPGHWEGDLIKGARNASAVGTLVERTTLFVTLARLDNASCCGRHRLPYRPRSGRCAATPFHALRSRARDGAPRAAVRTHRRYGLLRRPAQPLATGINENTNGLLRLGISPRGWISPVSLKPNSMPWAGNSTRDREKPSAGSDPPNCSCQSPSTSLKIIINLLPSDLKTAPFRTRGTGPEPSCGEWRHLSPHHMR